VPWSKPAIVVEVDGQQFLRERAEFGDESSRYVVDSWSWPLHWSQVELKSDYHLAEEDIVGALTVWEGPERTPVAIDAVDLLVRPQGFTRTLDTVHVERVEGKSLAVPDHVIRGPGVAAGVLLGDREVPNPRWPV
jgi:hypothetical protein